MKDILVLMVLLSAQTTKVCSQPYKVDFNGNCHNLTREYKLDDSNLCCKKCPPGQRLIQECSETTESVCKECDQGQYMEDWNYYGNCFSCIKCKSSRGLQYAQSCSSTKKSKCMCLPGMFCIMASEHCAECRKYKKCKAGYGVSVQGTEYSNVKCEQCPEGTFSDTLSHTDPCRPHTDCHRKAVVRKGNNISDTVCGHEDVTSTQLQKTTKEHLPGIEFPTTNPTRNTVLGLSSVANEVFENSTKSPSLHTETDKTKVNAVITGVTAFVLVILIIVVLRCKSSWKEDSEKNPKVDSNGNCNVQLNQGYLEETQLTVYTATSPEQQCLMEKGEACNENSQSSNNTETLTRTDGCSSHESIGPLQSTLAFNNSCSTLSEPMPLISNTDPATPQPSIPSQPSSHPTSPQIISPVTTNPHVNVNITFHIGNGSCGTPSIVPTDLKEEDCKLPFGEEEESFSIPQQEDGKQSLLSVQDSESYSV